MLTWIFSQFFNWSRWCRPRPGRFPKNTWKAPPFGELSSLWSMPSRTNLAKGPARASIQSHTQAASIFTENAFLATGLIAVFRKLGGLFAKLSPICSKLPRFHLARNYCVNAIILQAFFSQKSWEKLARNEDYRLFFNNYAKVQFSGYLGWPCIYNLKAGQKSPVGYYSNQNYKIWQSKL